MQAGAEEPASSSASSRSGCGSCTASTRRCRATSSSARSSHCSTTASSATPGLSEVSVADIEAASKVFQVATVQNRYNLVDRGSEDVLDYCEAQRHRFHSVVSAGRRRSRQAGLARSMASPRRMARPPARSRWPGCSSAARSCCRSPAPRRSRIWKKMSPRWISPCRIEEFAALDRAGPQGISRGVVNHVRAPMRDW